MALLSMKKNDNLSQEENEAVKKQIDNLKKEEGILYHYDREKRLQKRKRYTRNNREAINRAYKYGLTSIAIVCVLLVVLWLNEKRPITVEGNNIKVSLNFFHPDGAEVETQIKVKVQVKASPTKINKGAILIIQLEKQKDIIAKEVIHFPKDITIYPDYPLSYLVQIPKANFIKATHIRITSDELGLSGTIELI